MWRRGGGRGGEEAEGEHKEDDERDEPVESGICAAYQYGYDPRKHKAYRFRVGAPKQKEIAERIVEPSGASLMDAPLAVFRDGSTWPVATLTVEDLRLQGNGGAAEGIRQHAVKKRPAASPEALFAGLRDGVPCRLHWRSDRHWLISLSLKKGAKFKQVCQLRPDVVEAIGGESAPADIEAACIGIMKAVSEKFAAAKVDEGGLFALRDALLAKEGLHAPSAGGATAKAKAGAGGTAPARARAKARAGVGSPAEAKAKAGAGVGSPAKASAKAGAGGTTPAKARAKARAGGRAPAKARAKAGAGARAEAMAQTPSPTRKRAAPESEEGASSPGESPSEEEAVHAAPLAPPAPPRRQPQATAMENFMELSDDWLGAF